VGHRGIGFELEYLGEFEFVFELLQDMNEGIGRTCFDRKAAYYRSLVNLSLLRVCQIQKLLVSSS
jgi:hypothetical protein